MPVLPGLLGLLHAGGLADPDLARVKLGVFRDPQRGYHAAPRVPGQDQPLLVELRRQVQGQLLGVRHELADVHPAGIADRAVRLAGPRWSQLTTVKYFSRCRVLRRFEVSCDVPGPPCR